ncbi:MAG: VWA domain-containing protein [Gammaproteobacteria bacterium]|nr:VWA domain-containing protein [Gammaproteobacteria bacterium]
MLLTPASAIKLVLYKIKLFLIFSCLWLPAHVWSAQEIEPQNQSSDIRVLIDVSGSMKKNDPNNLRLPALRLLVGLLPTDASAAVWTFGTKAVPLVPLGLANEKWKKNAQLASKKIHSRDLFTNIGLALDAAVADWGQKPSKLNQRSIILLTDGMIDIGKDAEKNKQERTRLLKQMLPEIQKTGANIHTIALSKNADHAFLKELSTKTDGGFEQTESAEQLERIFLRLFEKTTKPDTVPLVDNKFLVDESIFELTLLVFKPQNARPTEVVEPNNKKYTQKTIPSYVKWQSEKNYDLITITKPKQGEWSINAQTDPDNRVLVVTNLQIQTNRMPNNLFVGENLNAALFMTDNNKKITDDNFLQFISMSAVQKEPSVKEAKNIKRWFLHDNGLRGDIEAHDGLFNVQVNNTLEIGNNKFTFQASTETLKREINHSVMVHDIKLLSTRVEQQQKGNKNFHQILVSPNIEFVDPRKITMTASLIAGDKLQDDDPGETIKFQQFNPKILEWSYESESLDPEKDYHIIVHMQTQTRTGRPIDYVSQPIQLNLPTFDNLLLTPDQLLAEEAPEINTDEEIIEELQEEISETEETDWLMSIIIAVVVNIIVGVGGFFGYRKWKNTRENAYDELTGELE